MPMMGLSALGGLPAYNGAALRGQARGSREWRHGFNHLDLMRFPRAALPGLMLRIEISSGRLFFSIAFNFLFGLFAACAH